MADDKNQKGSRLGCGCALLLLVLVAVVVASVWYIKQPEEKQSAIQDRTGRLVDTGARKIGGTATSLVGRASESLPVSNVIEKARDVTEAAIQKVEKMGEIRRTGEHSYKGLPRKHMYPNDLKVLKNKGYTVGYDEKRRNPAWVCYRVFRPESYDVPSLEASFKIDSRTKAGVGEEDYAGSGCEKGLCAPAFAMAVCFGRDAETEAYLMSNIVPRSPDLNSRPWANLAEKEIREYAKDYEELWVVTGGIFRDTPMKMNGRLEVPDDCFKIMVDEDNEGRSIRMLAFIMPQDPRRFEPLSSYLVSVDDIEHRTGLDFFPELDDEMERRLEGGKAERLWQ